MLHLSDIRSSVADIFNVVNRIYLHTSLHLSRFLLSALTLSAENITLNFKIHISLETCCPASFLGMSFTFDFSEPIKYF